jgi:hypothetical protein
MTDRGLRVDRQIFVHQGQSGGENALEARGGGRGHVGWNPLLKNKES